MAQWENLNYSQKSCVGSAGKMMQQTRMVSPGARIGVAVSGGMDSWTLTKVLQYRQRIAPLHFEIMALHLNPGFDINNHRPLENWLRREGIPYHIDITDHGIRAHSEENRKNSACFFCAMLRRTRLFELCEQYGLTHLAIGHNADDLVSTFFMNMTRTGKVHGLSIKEDFFGGKLKVIRPLIWVEKSVIRKASKAWELPIFDNPCPSALDSDRSGAMERASHLWGGDRRMKQNVFNALRRWQLDSTDITG